MMEFRRGDLFASGAAALVNSVNCMGVFGAGLALEFRRRFPEYQRFYEGACETGLLIPGTVQRCDHSHLTPGMPAVIYFPTKRDWRSHSRLADIHDGLIALRQELLYYGNYPSIALPALGCGRGGLRWDMVKYEIATVLAPLDRQMVVWVYEPWEERG